MKPADGQVGPEIVVDMRGGIAEDLPGYVREKVAAALVRTSRPVPRVHVRVVRHGDPARGDGVTAHANVDVDGRPLLVHAAAATPRAAVDLLVERLRHRLERLPRGRRPRRGHEDGQTPEVGEPEIVRHATNSPVRLSVDEAVVEMDDLGLDFHLFVETTTGQDALVYHDGPTGLRLNRSAGGPDIDGSHSVEVTVSPQRPPLLDTAEAVERLRVTGLPFLFYLDADHERATVLYHRDDGDYGLIDPSVR